jgi:hypothetical protein
MKDVLTVDASSTILLLMAIEAMYPAMRLIHILLDNARYHHTKPVQAWLAQPGRRIKLHFIPAYCPHVNPIERLWGLMHRHTTHNKCYSSFKDFSISMLTFLRDDVPRNWRIYCDAVTDNFRVRRKFHAATRGCTNAICCALLLCSMGELGKFLRRITG